MYGLSSDVDLSFFVGAVVIQVCVGENRLVLHLGDRIEVTIATSVSVAEPDVAAQLINAAPATGVWAIRLLGDKVVAALATNTGTLSLLFESGREVDILDEDPNHECYTISSPAGIIVV